ncbi:olfactory receptor 5V1-like [Ambystoma mexicanum]|uniref:olfactory receptor 5V1-like n=1 Tax=Ambystoma mexicanum TaxID=8296 RepID=UPI0037E76559
MEIENQTQIKHFIIVGFPQYSGLQVPLFLTFLLTYLVTLLGNLLIMAVVYSDPRLHTPMYFFLTNLSFIDITSTSVTLPKLLTSFMSAGCSISLPACIVQMYGLVCMMSTEFILLTVMAYDRYVAICNPLRYAIVMNKDACIKLAAGTWMAGLLQPIPHTVLVSRLSFCKSHHVNHFFCDITALLKISCTDTRSIETMTYVFGVLIVIGTFILIIISYIYIISTILKIQSSERRHKAFSTCTSHLAVVIIFSGAICIMYMRPNSKYSENQDKILSLMYIVVTPLLNPIIYSLKNTEFRKAFQRVQEQKVRKRI